jgi:hypothetical protein
MTVTTARSAEISARHPLAPLTVEEAGAAARLALAATGEHEHVAAFIDLEPAGPCAEPALPLPAGPVRLSPLTRSIKVISF